MTNLTNITANPTSLSNDKTVSGVLIDSVTPALTYDEPDVTYNETPNVYFETETGGLFPVPLTNITI